MRLPVFHLIVLVAIAAAACGGSSSSLGDGLVDREFWSTSVVENGVDRPLVDGTRITLNFRKDSIGVSAGCNNIGGELRLDGDRFDVTNMSWTEMGCDGPRHEQDNFVIEFFNAGPTASLDGDQLTLSIDELVMTFVDSSVANPDRPIIGTTWMISGFIDGDAAMGFGVAQPGMITFPDESSMTGFDGCREFTGNVEVSDGSTGGPIDGDAELQFGPVTEVGDGACAFQDYVDRVHNLFESGSAVATIEGDRMTLLDRNGVGFDLRAETV